MEEKWFERILIAAAIVGILVLFYANIVYAAPTVCQIGNGCTGASTAPVHGNLLIGGRTANMNSSPTRPWANPHRFKASSAAQEPSRPKQATNRTTENLCCAK
jgi:hypothetical protein